MKIAVISFSGNVGKSTISRHLLAPRLNDATIIPVESINSDGSQDDAIRGKQFGELQEALALMDDAVVDVGSSNVEVFVQLMKQYRNSHEEFDYFVVPTTSPDKQQRDTISTIDALAGIGVPASRICLVFNMVEFDETPQRTFSGLFKFHETANNFTLHPNAVIHRNDIYSKLKNANWGIYDILNDPTDFKEKIKHSKDTEEKVRFAQMLGIKRLAGGVSEELDAVFKTLFASVKV